MTRSVRTIIDELLALDPSLKEHEAALVPLVETLLKADPAREPDNRFLSDLRSQLQQRAATLSVSSTSSPRFSMTKLFPFLAGLTAAAVIAVPATSYYIHSDEPSARPGESLFVYKVTPTSPQAFGDLSGIPANEGGSRNQSGGGGPTGNPVPAMAPMADGAVEAYGMMDSTIIAPEGEWTLFEYSYDGAITDLPTETVDVLKRERRFLNAPLSLIADRFDLGTIDLSAFGSAKLEYANFIQDKEYGYAISLNMRDASIGIGMNWEKWPQPDCQTEACWKAQQIRIDQVPADADLLSIAAKFVSDYGIDTSHYGTPYVDQAWKRDYDRMKDKSQAYIPDTLRVIYPLQIEGKDVVETGGDKAGLFIGVNIKAKRVAEAWGMSDQTYTSSSYEAVTDEKTVRDYLTHVEQSFLDPAMIRSGEIKTKTVKVTLGAPVLGYGRVYNYQAVTQDELLVPSLIFPVTGTDGGEMPYRTSVVVPLARKLLEQQPPQIMPMMMEDAVK